MINYCYKLHVALAFNLFVIVLSKFIVVAECYITQYIYK